MIAKATLLIKGGYFDSVTGELTHAGLIWRLYAIQAGEPSWYVPIPPEYYSQQRLAHKPEILGFPLVGHPLIRFRDRVIGRFPIPARAGAVRGAEPSPSLGGARRHLHGR